ncbi:alpha/beta hydrolase [Flavobacterium aquariorum]|uniref:Alpha/beta hydrolase n=1 Tax=Flavobacterium aquariorum TaxID=2217670 RepID=A0A2W7TV96_9FLAO|nr:alpha/beta hydrolase [Flavobacterium aquariorum]PZX93326.1 alpha/beta hydrolase [Flavobacterium aquariorum]
MKTSKKQQLWFKKYVTFALAAAALFAGTTKIDAQEKLVKNIVIVHGHYLDASGWKGVYSILTKKGYHVTLVQNPLTSLKDDVAATNNILDNQDGPTILVGHSWGGTVITEAGMHPKVAGLVYVTGFMPDKGQTTRQLAKTFPKPPEMRTEAPDNGGFVFYDRSTFRAGVAGDLSKEDADFMNASQIPIHKDCFETPLTSAAWRTKPSYGILTLNDRTVNPDLQRSMYKNAKVEVTELKAGYVSYISQPKAVADVIIKASLLK